ncbi:MAG: ABC-type transporter, integral rane subunit [Myxococcaceae bacterium]|nr:ABC-type transporter, integral rane subunit [Myxococcaceae bacterium]
MRARTASSSSSTDLLGVSNAAATRAGSAASLDKPRDSIVQAARSGQPSRELTYLALSWVAPLIVLAIWEVLARVGVIGTIILPAPSTVLLTAKTLIQSGELQVNLLASVKRAVMGFSIGGSLGLSLGILVGFSKVADALLDRSLQALRAVPFLAILPLVVVWFGIGESGKVFLIALGSMFPMYLNTALGIRQVDPKLVEMARVMGLSGPRLVAYTILPGALPSILNGVRYALTTSWLALVVAETLGASAGIGFLATNAREFLQTDVMVLVIILYALIGLASDQLARLLERQLLGWHPNYAKPRS